MASDTVTKMNMTGIGKEVQDAQGTMKATQPTTNIKTVNMMPHTTIQPKSREAEGTGSTDPTRKTDPTVLENTLMVCDNRDNSSSTVDAEPNISKDEEQKKTAHDEELERLAMDELLLEAKRGAERAKEIGIAGWLKPAVPPTNKRFLENTIKSTLPRTRQYGSRSRSGDQHKGSRRDSDSRRRSLSPSRSRSPRQDSRSRRRRQSTSKGRTSESFHRKDSVSRSHRSRRSRDRDTHTSHSKELRHKKEQDTHKDDKQRGSKKSAESPKSGSKRSHGKTSVDKVTGSLHDQKGRKDSDARSERGDKSNNGNCSKHQDAHDDHVLESSKDGGVQEKNRASEASDLALVEPGANTTITAVSSTSSTGNHHQKDTKQNSEKSELATKRENKDIAISQQDKAAASLDESSVGKSSDVPATDVDLDSSLKDDLGLSVGMVKGDCNSKKSLKVNIAPPDVVEDPVVPARPENPNNKRMVASLEDKTGTKDRDLPQTSKVKDSLSETEGPGPVKKRKKTEKSHHRSSGTEGGKKKKKKHKHDKHKHKKHKSKD